MADYPKNHNNPPVTVELTEEQAKFLIENCNTNIAFSLSNLQQVSPKTAEKLVKLIEDFRGVRDAITKVFPDALKS